MPYVYMTERRFIETVNDFGDLFLWIEFLSLPWLTNLITDEDVDYWVYEELKYAMDEGVSRNTLLHMLKDIPEDYTFYIVGNNGGITGYHLEEFEDLKASVLFDARFHNLFEVDPSEMGIEEEVEGVSVFHCEDSGEAEGEVSASSLYS